MWNKLIAFGLALSSCAIAQVPVIPSQTVGQTWETAFAKGAKETRALSNFRLVLSYDSQVPAKLHLTEEHALDLPKGAHQLDLEFERMTGKAGRIEASLDGAPMFAPKSLPAPVVGGSSFQSDSAVLKTNGDYTVAATFSTKEGGSLFSKSPPEGKWAPNAKVLFIKGGRLAYDIGWKGQMGGGPKVNDGKPHRVVLVVREGTAEIFVDGKSAGQKEGFTAKDEKNHVFKIGKASSDFGFDFKGGEIANVRYWDRGIEGAELRDLTAGKLDSVNTPDLNWSPDGSADSAGSAETFSGKGHAGTTSKVRLEAGAGFEIKKAQIQPLGIADHAQLITNWNAESLAEGKMIYQSLCVTCHGTPGQEGSLPTALKFHEGEFKNGSDPFRMFQTLEKGYGLMVPQPQYSAAQKYALIQYIRETFLKPHNSKEYAKIDDAYLARLPRRLESYEEQVAPNQESTKPWEKMDYGRSLHWTYEISGGGNVLDWNIAQKGIAVRLDPGPGGVAKGQAFLVYDEDTMRVAAGYQGSFINWRGIAFDQSHGSHAKIGAEPTFRTPDAPAWENPVSGGWDNSVRVEGKDGRRFGPLPREWVHYKGMYVHGDERVISYTVGEAAILEKPSFISYGPASLFVRTLNIGKSPHDLVHRIAEETEGLEVTLGLRKGANPDAKIEISKKDGFVVLRVPSGDTPIDLNLILTKAKGEVIDGLIPEPTDLQAQIKGGPARFADTVIEVKGERGNEEEAFAVDSIPVPNQSENPWNSWMRLGGFDFFPENPDRAAVCTWLGDVWLVDGVAGDLSEVKWKRICSGLFQPLGLKIVGGKIYVTCRDQIAKLHDLNGDEEIDFVENFNNDHQVTEHFHEFAMGLQTDDDGNFYYAKSARHAKKAVVPHHGTLLRVSPDGSTTDIVATGFRAANGVCLNPDGTWIVTDQEGHWNPKNRINYVREGGFYGNMFGYHDVTNSADSAMEQPLCWITNAFDRSPAELLWVPKDGKWGALNGVLLNLSYGYGKVYTVPHQILSDGQAQGGMCQLPIPQFPTGVHRGRFHPETGDLYVVGMFAWAGSQKQDGGFYRIRPTGKPAYQPVQLRAAPGVVTIDFTDEMPSGTKFEIKAWDLKRTASYGSKHSHEKKLEVQEVEIEGREARLHIADLEPTWCMEIKCRLPDGGERVIHNSIHRLE